MKALVVACILFSGCTSARAQVPTPPDPIVTIALPSSQWNTVLQGLGELPLKASFALVQNIQNQAAAQLKLKDEPKKEK